MRVGLLCLGFTLLMGSLAPTGCRTTSGGQSGDEGGVTDRTDGVASPPTDTQPSCAHAVSYGPDERLSSSMCESTDERYRSGELKWLGGDSPAGPYRCICPDGWHDVPDAGSCEQALEQTCGVDLNEPRACYEQLRPYSRADLRDGNPPYSICYPVRDVPGSWRCQCDRDGPLTPVQDQECMSALLATCECPSNPDPDAGTCWVPKLDAGAGG